MADGNVKINIEEARGREDLVWRFALISDFAYLSSVTTIGIDAGLSRLGAMRFEGGAPGSKAAR